MVQRSRRSAHHAGLTDLPWDVSTDGRTVLYSHGESLDQPAGIYAIDTLPGAIPQFVMPLAPSGLDPNALRFSPDRKSIAFESGIEIWILSLVDNTPRQITFTDGNAVDPDWDPTGSLLVYERPFLRYGAPDTSSGLFLVNVGTLAERHLRHDGLPTYGGDPRWSPDGQTIVFTYGAPLHVYRVNTDGSGYQDLTPGSLRYNENPEWIEGGAKLVYESFSGTNPSDHHTRVVNADGTGDAAYQVQLSPFGTRSSLAPDRGFVVYDSLETTYNHLVLFMKPALPSAPSALTAPRQLTVYARRAPPSRPLDDHRRLSGVLG